MSDDRTFKTPDGEETVTVPETFERDDYAAHFGSVPDEWDVQRVFIHEDTLRAEALINSTTIVEAIYHTDGSQPVFNASENGWVVETADVREGTEISGDHPGETLWTAEVDDE